MVEASLVRRELERGLIASARAGRPVSIELAVRDAATVAPELVRLQAIDALERLGLADLPIPLIAEPRSCAACEWRAIPVRGQQQCPDCGAPLLTIVGRPIEAHVRHGGRPRTCSTHRRIE